MCVRDQIAICPLYWRSLAFCNTSVTIEQHGRYIWNRAEAESNISILCQYNNNPYDRAYRWCNERGQWESIIYDNCLTLSESILQTVENVSMTLLHAVHAWCNTILLCLDFCVSRNTTNNHQWCIRSSFECH